MVRKRRRTLPLMSGTGLRLLAKGAVAWQKMVQHALLSPAVPALVSGRVGERTGFGSNPGKLRMLVWSPKSPMPPGAPLIVVLHGCGQRAGAFAADTGWIALAARIGAVLLLPEQTSDNNRGRCFHWYRSDDVRRGSGEVMSIRQMLRTALGDYRCDPKRVFIVGLSAGGAMAVAMLAAYPSVFAAGAVVAGMPVGTAHGIGHALMRMRRAATMDATGLAQAVRRQAPPALRRTWPRLSIWQGGQDRQIDPANADLLAAQWSTLHGHGGPPLRDDMPGRPGIRRRSWGTSKRVAVELWSLDAIDHGFPIDAQQAGGGKPGFAILDAGIAAAAHIAAFWGLTE